MEGEKYGKIKVYFKDEPNKIKAYLKNVSKVDTLNMIREQIKKYIKEDFLFLSSDGDIFERNLEEDSDLSDILVDDKGNLKIFILPQIQEEKKVEVKEENNIQNEPVKTEIEDNQKNIKKEEQNVNEISKDIKTSDNLLKEGENLIIQNNDNELKNNTEKESVKNEINSNIKKDNISQNKNESQIIQENNESNVKTNEQKDDNDSVKNQSNDKVNEIKNNTLKNVENLPNNNIIIRNIDNNEDEKNLNKEQNVISNINPEINKIEDNTDKHAINESLNKITLENSDKSQNKNIINRDSNMFNLLGVNKKIKLFDLDEIEENQNINIVKKNVNPKFEMKGQIELSDISDQINTSKTINTMFQKNKEYFFSAIVNSQYSEKIKFELISDEKIVHKDKKENIFDFENIEVSNRLWGTTTISRKLHLFKARILSKNDFIQLKIQIDNKEPQFFDINLMKYKKSIILNLKPFNEIKGNQNIFFDLKTDKEKDTYIKHLVDFFKEENITWKKEFIQTYMKDITITKKVDHIFSLVELFGGNLLDTHFSPVFIGIEKFTYENPFNITKKDRDKVLKLYNDIKMEQNKEEIHINIYTFLILLLMKLRETNKVIDILSIIETLKDFTPITKLLFSQIKKLINIIPDIKLYFTYILKYQPNEINYISNFITYKNYLDIIIQNSKYLKNQLLKIFPEKMKKNINNDEDILHKIIIIIQENGNNCDFDCQYFRIKFSDKYLKCLNREEKKVFKEFLEKNSLENDQDSKDTINELEFDYLKNCKDNKQLIEALTTKKITHKLLDICSENMNLQNLSENDLNNLAEIYKKVFEADKKIKKYIIYGKYINKSMRLKDFLKIKNLFGVFIYKKDLIPMLITAFWGMYNKEEKCFDQDNIQIFSYMFFLIEKNDVEKTLDFLNNINKIENNEFVLNIYEIILQIKDQLNLNQKKIISNFYIKQPLKKEIDLINTYNFILEYFDDKIIEIDDFYKTSNEITTNFKIFNYLNTKNEFQSTNFYKNSFNNFNEFLNSIKNKDISLSQLNNLNALIKSEEFNSKIDSFNFDKEKKNDLFKEIESNANLITEKILKLEKCKKYLDIFTSSEDTKLKNALDLRLKERDKSIKEFLNLINESNFSDKLDKLYERSLKYNKIKTLKLSIIFFNELENRVDKEEEKMNYLENKINDMKKILSPITVGNNFDEFLYLFEDEKELLDEINKLKKYFNIDYDTSIIENYLIYKLKYFKFEKTLSNYIGLITQFNLTQTNFFKKIKELSENISELNKIENIYDENNLVEKISTLNYFLSNFENIDDTLNLNLIPMDITSFVVNKFQENFLLSFLSDLTINDLRDITNSLTGSSLDINDINNYQFIKSIITTLKEKSGLQDNNEEENNDNNIDNENQTTSTPNSSLTDIDFIKLISPTINEKLNGKSIDEFKIILNKCSQNKQKLLLLFENKKGIEANKDDIKSIIKESTFEIYSDEDNNKNNIYSTESRYNCSCIYEERTKQKNLKELIVFQQLASLSQNEEKKEENEILNKFIDLIENIKEILSIIDKITYKGFPTNFYYRIRIKDGIAICENGNVELNQNKKITEEKSFLKELLKRINKSQINAYKSKKFLKFYYGQQLTVFNNYLKAGSVNNSNEEEVSNLIYYIIGNKFKTFPKNFVYRSSISSSLPKKSNIKNNKDLVKLLSNNIKYEDCDNINNLKKNLNDTLNSNDFLRDLTISKDLKILDIRTLKSNTKIDYYKQTPNIPIMKQGSEKELQMLMDDMYDNVENYLKDIMKINNINEKTIFENSIIKNEEYKNKYGFYIFNSGQNIYNYILKFYHGLVGNSPPRFCLMLCNEETSLEEFISFLYLAIFCPYHSLFIIAKPDRLNLDIIYEVENILEKTHEKENEIKSLILFLFDDIGKSEIGKELLKICKSADDPSKNMRKKTTSMTSFLFSSANCYPNIEVVLSNSAGYGKSFYIQKKCKEKGLNYISFPIGGGMKRQTIMRRLKKLDLEKKGKQYGLHLDVSDTKQIELFEDFLFSFLVQKFYSNNENIFCYEDNVTIFIEIQNGFLNLVEKFKIFKEFNITRIDKLPKLELQENQESFQDFKNNNNKIEEENDINYLYQSDIQLVCNYLKNLDSMSKYNLFFDKLNEKSKLSLGYDYYINATFINQEECRKLLDTYFKKDNKSYHQINIYIKVLADQLRRFSINVYLTVESLYYSMLPGDTRTDIIHAFLDLTNFFTIGAFDDIVSIQNLSLDEKNRNNFNEDKEIINAANMLSMENPNINFKELNDKGFIFVNNDGQSLTFITCAPKDSDIYKKLDQLYNSGAKFGKDKSAHLSIPDFTKMEKNEEFLEVIKTIIDSHEDISTIKNKLGTYVFNEDNFFKMVQIMLRLRAGIPVLIMGETGCGKTSLINTIAEINSYKMLIFNIHAGVTDNEIVQFMVKNNLLENKLGYDEDEDDIEHIFNHKNDEDDSASISVSNMSIKNNINNENEKNEDEKKEEKIKIVFFDEFNTCNSFGLLTEIMCTKKCQGVNVKKNVLFAGACNPYRKIKKKKLENGQYESTALIKEGSPISKQNLVYSVNPLTYTQLYYIFNFGSLTEENEKKYITGIVEGEIDEYVNDKNLLPEIKKLMINSFTTAQSFIREINGKESVSMRETRKFMTIYKFLITDFERKQKLAEIYSRKPENEKIESKEHDYNFYLGKDEFLGHKYSISAAIYICFYIRLYQNDKKMEFSEKMNKIFSFDFLSYPEQLQEELISNIKLEKGIAANKSLKLNLFICFIGILTRIAVFLVGPPGCSKTLCFNLLKKEMKGSLSKSKFWQEYPQLIITSYQGSLTSTSKGIIDTFKDGEKKLKDFNKKNKGNRKSTKIKEKTEKSISTKDIGFKKIKEKKDKGIIVCIYIDEIGLCELSPSNPLKALHTYLELDYKNQNIEEKLAFVGISNWKLDAAKMNRGIYLNVLNPILDKKQMEETAYKITEIYKNSFSKDYEDLLKNLTLVINKYHLYLKEIKDDQANFHGTRDFYSLIKTVTKKIIDKTSENPNEENIELKAALFAIECNYNGISRNGINSSDHIKNEFKTIYTKAKDIPNFGIAKCIKNNLDSDYSRYLLLIMKSNLSQYLILNIIKDIKEENKIIYYLGSLFEDDLYNEAYSAKTINKIKFYLEHDIILILKNLSTTYSSLYDLFNQSFTYIKNKKFVEISLGEVSNSCYVNDGLKIIVLIKDEMVKEQDPPFLNRFEKYYASFDNILDENGRNMADKILKYKKALFGKKKGKMKYNFENELINFYGEEIKSLICDYKIKLDNKDNLNEDEIFDLIFQNISKTLPQELIAYINYYRKDNYYEEVNKINKYYSNSIHSNLQTFLKKTNKSINVIYTFTPTVRSSKFNFEVENKITGKINSENINNSIHINLLKTERQLEIEISDFYDSKNKLLLIHFEESDAENLEFVLSFLERCEKEKNINNEKKKIIIILIHLTRKQEPYNLDIFVPNLSGIEQTFIDNLYGKDINILDIINQKIRVLYRNKQLIDIYELFRDELFSCFQKIEYLFQDDSIEQKYYIENIINMVLGNENLIKKILVRIFNEIDKTQNIIDEEKDDENEIREETKNTFYDNIFEKNFSDIDIDFVSIISNELNQLFIKYLNKFIINSEKLTILSSLSKKLPKSAKNIWENLLNDFDFSKEINDNLKSNKIKVWTKLNLPSIKSIENIKNSIESDTDQLIATYLEQEKEIRECNEAADIVENDEENEETEEEIDEKKKLVNDFFSKDNNNIDASKYRLAKETIKEFFVPKKNVINYVKKQIEKDNFIKSLRGKDEDELLELFFRDYFSQIITLLIQSEEPFYYDILIYLINLRFNNEKNIDNILDFYSKGILWINIYKDEFIFLLRNFQLLKKIFPDILKEVKKKIETKEVDYIVSSHHPRHKRLIDKPFLLILDSLFFNLIEKIEALNGPKIMELMNIFSEVVQNGEIYNSNLSLKSKDFYRFKTLFISIKLFKEKQVYKKEETDLYIKYIKNERKMLLKNDNKKVAEEIRKQIELLMKKLPECEEKTKTVMKILISKYKEITDIKCREILCDIILKDNKLLKISNEFLIHILDAFSFTPDSLDLKNNNPDNPFAKSVEKNKNFPLLKKIDEKVNCKILSENLKYIFKFKIYNYYEEINKQIEIEDDKIKTEINNYLGDKSLLYFKNAYDSLIEIRNAKNKNKIKNKDIKKIFCIVYCSFFLEKFVYYISKQKNLVSACRSEIIKFLKGGETDIKKTFKLFILKELKTKYIIERTNFLNIEKWSEEYLLKELFENFKFYKKTDDELQGSLENLFFGGYEIEYLRQEKDRRNFQSSNEIYKNRKLSLSEFLCNLDIFINENLSTLKTKEGQVLCKNSLIMKEFNNLVNKSSVYSSSTKKLINLFFEEKEYNNKLSKTIRETNYFEILLYAYKFSILCSLSNNNSIYSKMINEKIIDNIKKAYIPGADLYCDLWVEAYLNMKKKVGQNHDSGYACGYYICDCGEYYFQQSCGVPTDISYCANCYKKIGGLDQRLIKREEDKGVYKIRRIYPSEKNKNLVEARSDLKSIYGEKFENGYPYEMFNNFEERMKKEMNKDYKGIYEPSYLTFIDEAKTIRNLNSQITYRLLNFIVYSNIYFSLKCGYITFKDININNYIPIEEKPYEGNYSLDDSYNDYRAYLLNERKKGISDEKSIIEILRLNWVILEKQLKSKNISSIQIFINTIIGDLFNLMKNCGEMSTPEQRNRFEIEVDKLINQSITDYKINSQNYTKNIEKVMSSSLELEYIILERDNMIENIDYKFPYYYEFLSIPIVKENDIKEILKTIENVDKKYPVLCSYLNSSKKNIEYLQTFSQINNFVNYTIEHYSNTISREEAKSRKIIEEIKKKEIPNNLFNEFLKAFNEHKLYEIATQFDCHSFKFPLRKFNQNDYLSTFLIDNGVQDYGMQIAGLYQKFISFQNSFLDNVIYNIPENNNNIGMEKLVYLKEKIKQEINCQKANKYNIISFDITTENYNSFLEMVLFYSYKDSFKENFEFDFSKKDKIKFNLEDIEEQLEYLLLPGKKKFNNKLDFVIYQYEGFRNQNSSVLTTFISQYPQEDLNEGEKKILYDFRNEQYSTDSIKKILFSIQLMITFYTEQLTPDKNALISETINDFPHYFKIPEDTKSLFKNPFTISKIISVYEFFEFLCFGEFRKNIDPNYKEELNEEKKSKINIYFQKEENKNILINKIVICTTIRKFISRSLVGIREDLEIGANIELFGILLYKEDCWNREIYTNYMFDNEIEKLQGLDIKVGEILNLYDYLGGDYTLYGENIKSKQEDKEEEEIKNPAKKDKNKKKKKQGKKTVF